MQQYSLELSSKLPAINLFLPICDLYTRASSPIEVYNLGLHESMFQNTIQQQMTAEQKQVWLPRVRDYQLIGTYAQTELGHGMLFLQDIPHKFHPNFDHIILFFLGKTSLFIPKRVGVVYCHFRSSLLEYFQL